MYSPILVFSQSLIGFGGGINYSKAIPENPEYSEFYKSSYQLGYGAGMIYDLSINQSFSVYSELKYSKRCKKIENNIEQHYSKAYFNYLEFPILIRLKQNYNGFTGYLNAGPQLGYWLGSKGSIYLFDNNYQAYNEKDFKLNFNSNSTEQENYITEANRSQLGLILGGGFLMQTNKISNLQFDFRLVLGHTNFSNDLNEGIYSPDFIENYRSVFKSLEISVAYLLNIKELKRQLR